MESSTTIKKRDAVATRAAILTAAHQRFLRESYDSVGLRDIAGDARVDVALISRYFGGKEGLFREVVADEGRQNPFLEPKTISALPAFLAQMVAEDGGDERDRRMEMFIIMLRSASSPKAGQIIRDLVHLDVLGPLTDLIGGEHGALRANMLLAILMGIGVLRSIMLIDDINDVANPDECMARFQGLFEAALSC